MFLKFRQSGKMLPNPVILDYQKTLKRSIQELFVKVKSCESDPSQMAVSISYFLAWILQQQQQLVFSRLIMIADQKGLRALGLDTSPSLCLYFSLYLPVTICLFVYLYLSPCHSMVTLIPFSICLCSCNYNTNQFLIFCFVFLLLEFCFH